MTEETNQSPAAAEPTGPLTESAAAELLQNWSDEPEQQEPQVDSARARQNAAEEAAESAEAALAPTEAEPEAEVSSEDEPPAEGDTDAPESDDDYVHGNQRTRLRDGTVTTVGELKKLADEAREFKRQYGDFTAKQRDFEAKSAQIAQQEQLFARTIEQAVAALQHSLPPEPEAALRDNDPIAYFLQKDARDAKMQEIARLNQAQQVAADKAQAEHAEQFQQYIKREQTQLFERIPELRDDTKRREFYNDMVSSAKAYGFSQEDIDSVHDHRTMLMIRDAMAFRKLQAAKPKAVEKSKAAKPVAKPGERAAPQGAVSAKHKTLFERARKTRSIDDVGALLAELE